MKIVENTDKGKMVLQISGRLDSSTAPQLQEYVDRKLEGVSELLMDLNNLEYISSAGLRVFLSAGKKMKAAEGEMVITGANEEIREAFKITGFDTILKIQ